MSAPRTRLATVRTAERRGPDRPSEDRIFTTENAVIVLDGASQPDYSEHDGGWLAETLGEELVRRLSGTEDDLGRILANGIATIAERYDLLPGRAPSTTVAIVR